MGMIACIRKNFGDWPSAKIGLHENFPLYGISAQESGNLHDCS
jgi:hypothetical protein